MRNIYTHVSTFALGLLVAAVVGYLAEPGPDASAATTYGARVAQLRQLSARNVGAVMVGDSLTERGEWAELAGPCFVDRGVGRELSSQTLKRLDTVPTANASFLMIGANDLNKGVAPEEIAANTRAIVARLPGRVYVQSVLYRSDPDYRDKTDAVNVANARFCATGACAFVDLNQVLAPGGTLPERHTLDGVHLSGPAYRIWAREITRLYRCP